MRDRSSPNRRTPSPVEQTTMFESSEPNIQSSHERTRPKASGLMKGSRTLSRLSDRIDLAIRELDRLRSENKELRKKLDRLASQTSNESEGTQVVFSETPRELRGLIETCIQAIDDHMSSHSEG